MDDGYNTTVVLDCGCTFRLNLGPDDEWMVDYYASCPTGQHSEIREYDQRTGDPIYERDRLTVAIQPDAQFDGSSEGHHDAT